MRNNLVLTAAALLMAACVSDPQLMPDETATRAPPTRSTAATTLLGVRVSVDGDAWATGPARLAELVTRVRVRIDNTSGRPMRIGYADFTLQGEREYRALPLLSPDDAPVSSLDEAPGVRLVQAPAQTMLPQHKHVRPAPRFQSRGFFVAPYFAQQYPKYEPWPRQLRGMRRGGVELPASLPTDEMLSDGLPEGVLESGGFVQGFVFFERVERNEQHLAFRVRMTDPDTAQQFGTIEIPLAVRW